MNRSISTLIGRSRKLDGGAMFGSTPRSSWIKWIGPDHNNQIELATRAFWVQQAGQNILVLAVTNAPLDSPTRTCRCQRLAHSLMDSLSLHGFGEGQIHVLLLTHLHTILPADLCEVVGEGDTPRLLFPVARYITGRHHWLRARHPHPRDWALFVPQIISQLEGSGRLDLLDERGSDRLGPGWHFQLSDGYTSGQLLPEIDMPGGPIVFAGDLVPPVQWLRLDLTTAFDRNLEYQIDEKESLLDHLVANGGRLFLPRDPSVAMIKVMRDRKSRYQPFDHHAELYRVDS